MDTWRAHVPVGMLLKSEPYGSAIASPKRGYDVPALLQAARIDYVKGSVPLTLDRFLGYADWYTEQLVPGLRDITATDISCRRRRVPGRVRRRRAGYRPQVVLATGVLPYAHIPAELSGLPSDLVTHTSDHHDLDRFHGRRVAVVGAGQSATGDGGAAARAGNRRHGSSRGSRRSTDRAQPGGAERSRPYQAAGDQASARDGTAPSGTPRRPSAGFPRTCGSPRHGPCSGPTGPGG